MSELPPTSRSRLPLPPPAKRGLFFNPDRPKIVGMAAWFCMAIGYVGTVMKTAQLPVLFFPEQMKKLNPNFIPIPYSREQFSIAVFSLLIGIAISIGCIVAAVGTLKLRQWGRRGIIWYAIIGAVATLAKSAWQMRMFDFMIEFQLSTTTQPVDRQLMENRQFFALIVMTIVQLVWFGGLILVMSNHWVRERFDAVNARTAPASADWQSRAGEN